MLPNGMPVVLFVPQKASPKAILEMVAEQFQETINRIRGDQKLFGYALPVASFPLVAPFPDLVELDPNAPLLKSSFVSSYRQKRLIAVTSLGHAFRGPKTPPMSDRMSIMSLPEPSGSQIVSSSNPRKSLRQTMEQGRVTSSRISQNPRSRASTLMLPSQQLLSPDADVRASISDKLGRIEIANRRLTGNAKSKGLIEFIIVKDQQELILSLPPSVNEGIIKRIALQRIYEEINEEEAKTLASRYTLKVTGTSYFRSEEPRLNSSHVSQSRMPSSA